MELSQAAIAATADPAQLDELPAELAEPEWITRAADELGYSWARIAWRRCAAQPGAWFDAAKADAVIARWPSWFKLTVGRFAGLPFRLSFWQEVIVRLLIGWKIPIEVIDPETGKPTIVYARLYRELRLWVPRKNGKSEFLAALALLFWAIEGQRRGAGFCFAHDEAQAREVFDKMADMIAYTPAVYRSASSGEPIRVFAKQLWNAELRSPFRLLPGKAKGKHGRAPFVTVGDEMHEWVSTELADTLRQGEGASLQPMRLYASTAGLKSQKVGYQLWQESLQILDGRVDSPTTLVVVFAIDEDEDWRDPSNWKRANPSIGLSPTMAFLRGEAAIAETSLAKEAAFRRYHLNQWVEQYQRWIPLRKWDASTSGADLWRGMAAELRGRSCTLAFDSTWVKDFASICLRFEPIEPGEKVKFLWRFWLPSETIERRTREERVPFDKWEKEGAISAVPGATFQNSFAVKATIEAFQQFDVQRVGWDSWTAKEYYNACVDQGVAEEKFLEMRMGTRTLGEATKQFEMHVEDRTLEHGGNPVARWMIGHCNVRFDENMSYVPAKKRSDDSIDGIFTAVMAQALAKAEKVHEPRMRIL